MVNNTKFIQKSEHLNKMPPLKNNIKTACNSQEGDILRRN